jgi:hypothetical protein
MQFVHGEIIIKSYVIILLIHQSRAHRGHIQYEHLLQLFCNITSNEKKKAVFTKKKKKNQQNKMCLLSECNMDL